jgi:hypothetical protein
MRVCDSCQKGEGTLHVTVRWDMVGPKATKVKHAQFWLCESCEMASRQVLVRDALLAQRMARRLTEEPEFLSRYHDWRTRQRVEWRRQ